MKVKKGGGDSEDNFLWEMSERHGGGTLVPPMESGAKRAHAKFLR
jgi:hypothetical protein